MEIRNPFLDPWLRIETKDISFSSKIISFQALITYALIRKQRENQSFSEFLKSIKVSVEEFEEKLIEVVSGMCESFQNEEHISSAIHTMNILSEIINAGFLSKHAVVGLRKAAGSKFISVSEEVVEKIGKGDNSKAVDLLHAIELNATHFKFIKGLPRKYIEARAVKFRLGQLKKCLQYDFLECDRLYEVFLKKFFIVDTVQILREYDDEVKKIVLGMGNIYLQTLWYLFKNKSNDNPLVLSADMNLSEFEEIVQGYESPLESGMIPEYLTYDCWSPKSWDLIKAIAKKEFGNLQKKIAEETEEFFKL